MIARIVSAAEKTFNEASLRFKWCKVVQYGTKRYSGEVFDGCSVEPLVSEDLLDREALAGVFCEHATEEVFSVFAEGRDLGVCLSVESLSDDSQVLLSLALSPEGELG